MSFVGIRFCCWWVEIGGGLKVLFQGIHMMGWNLQQQQLGGVMFVVVLVELLVVENEVVEQDQEL